jgi:GNAT superfamily N-acetyltransferase
MNAQANQLPKKPGVRIRTALPADVPALTALIEVSVRVLQAPDYTPEQLEAALKHIYGVDTQLIADGTYFLAEATSPPSGSSGSDSLPPIAGCGGWSKHRTLFGGDQWTSREDDLLDPKRDAAKIRAFFIHPAWARRGIGSMILAACEDAARAAGFTRCEMGATLTGVPMYAARGYVEIERVDATLPGGILFPIVRMAKVIAERAA